MLSLSKAFLFHYVFYFKCASWHKMNIIFKNLSMGNNYIERIHESVIEII